MPQTYVIDHQTMLTEYRSNDPVTGLLRIPFIVAIAEVTFADGVDVLGMPRVQGTPKLSWRLEMRLDP
jgi:hypothetical protein